MIDNILDRNTFYKTSLICIWYVFILTTSNKQLFVIWNNPKVLIALKNMDSYGY